MATDAMPKLAEQIMSASESAWEKLRQALQVKSREQAIELVNSDEEAAAAAQAILSSSNKSALTNTKAPMSALTQPPVDIPTTGKSRPMRMKF